MKQKITILLVGFLLTLGISSCVKDSAPELGDRGNTIIKFNDGPTKALFYSPFTNTKVVTLFTFRRDANSAADLQKPVEITLAEDATLIPAGYTDLPSTMYTLVADPSITVAAGKVTMRFAAGEFSKSLKINLNGAAWTNLSTSYAKYYKVFDAATKQVAAGQATMTVTMAIKNAWDGVYEVTGTMTDVANPALANINDYLGADGPMQFELRTTNIDKNDSYDNFFFGGYYKPIFTGASYSQYGSFSVSFQFDAATNKVIGVTNYYGQPASNGRYAELDPAGINEYDPATKTMRVSYFMFQPSVVPLPNPRVSFTEVWKFIKERE
jgi:hypothetical protein